VDLKQSDTDPVWKPTLSGIARSHMAQFIKRYGGSPEADYADLYQWSLDYPDDFWAAVAEFADIHFSTPPESILRAADHIKDTVWFEGATLNFAEHLLAGDPSCQVLVSVAESGRRRTFTRGELRGEVAAIAAALTQSGVKPGDRVAAVLPNCAEALIAMLAAASVGAVFSSCSPDCGEASIKDRFEQISPSVLFFCDGYNYAGKQINCLEQAAAVANALTSVKKFVVVPILQARPELSETPAAVFFADFGIAGSPASYLPLPFAHPLFILYSSGTTGKPKCIVHGAGGTLLQHKKELLLHVDLHAEDTLLYFTSCGWMMWNWLVSALSTGASIVLYDGSPTQPESTSLLTLAAAEQVTVLGTSPRYLAMLEKTSAGKTTGWPELRTVLSTGAPLAPSSYDFVRKTLGSEVQLSSISGGTDIISCFALGNPVLAVYRGEIQCIGLGMAVDVFDPAGSSLTGVAGELVCTQAFPSMPLGFWNDNGEKYQAAYFEKYPGIWAHGDLAELTAHGGLHIYGRSDAVLNPGGVRIGSAEICGPAMSLAEITDAIAVSQRQADEERILLFVVLRKGVELDAVLEKNIADAVRQQASPRHVPALIIDVPDIPRTLSGKHVELAVKAIIHGEPVANVDVLANPEALEYFRGRV
jgi:acetoacetyl-CoA synthetase